MRLESSKVKAVASNRDGYTTETKQDPALLRTIARHSLLTRLTTPIRASRRGPLAIRFPLVLALIDFDPANRLFVVQALDQPTSLELDEPRANCAGMRVPTPAERWLYPTRHLGRREPAIGIQYRENFSIVFSEI